MFDHSGLPTSTFCDDASETSVSVPAAEPRPVEYVVCKDGKPFAILNATPVLAARTVTGFALATPGTHWTFERI
ncbi:MAG: hypothetical protein K2X44_07715 [Magnetospirillum sp.]|nr:hypothetical protein [Magnetospirillum sp.]